MPPETVEQVTAEKQKSKEERRKEKKAKRPGNAAMEKIMTQMAQYVKGAKAGAGAADEIIHVMTDDKRKMSICCREKIHLVQDSVQSTRFAESEITWGIATCSPGDRFNKTVGEYVAIKRARNGKIPKTFLPYI